ncbi:MAG: hypothetical protein R3A10_16565 [Caldilineaceae bacterium]
MDIGTAKATPAEQARFPSPHRHPRPRRDAHAGRISGAGLRRHRRSSTGRGHVPFLVGGTALYIRAVVRGLRIPNVLPNPAPGPIWKIFWTRRGGRRSSRVWPRPIRRRPRSSTQNPPRPCALEIFLTTGRPKNRVEGEDPPPYRTLMLFALRNSMREWMRAWMPWSGTG